MWLRLKPAMRIFSFFCHSLLNLTGLSFLCHFRVMNSESSSSLSVKRTEKWWNKQRKWGDLGVSEKPILGPRVGYRVAALARDKLPD